MSEKLGYNNEVSCQATLHEEQSHWSPLLWHTQEKQGVFDCTVVFSELLEGRGFRGGVDFLWEGINVLEGIEVWVHAGGCAGKPLKGWLVFPLPLDSLDSLQLPDVSNSAAAAASAAQGSVVCAQPT